MIAKKSDDADQVGKGPHEERKLQPHELEWYGDAYESLYLQKLQMDEKLKDLAAKLQPRQTTVH